MIYVLIALSVLGLLTSTVFGALVLAATRYHLRERTAADHTWRDFQPALTVVKPLHGNEPDLAARLETFFQQDYGEFEVLFCARDQNDSGLHTARQVAVRYPHVPVKHLSTSGEPDYINAKIASLETMMREASHPIFVISDSDVQVTPEYLSEVGRLFADERVGAVTCLYRGVPGDGGVWARLEAVGMSVEMTAGVLVAKMLEGMQFALGPTMAVRRECVDRMGGVGTMAEFCSDDYILGNQVFAQGRKVVLSQHVIDHVILNDRFVDSMKHQARWMKSTRFSRPAGHFWSVLTFSMPFGLMGLLAALTAGRPGLALALFCWALSSRWMIAWAAGQRVVGDPRWLDLYLLYPLRDLMGFGFWVASYASSRIVWRGRVFELTAGGRMVRA